jgi:hypothetical protein
VSAAFVAVTIQVPSPAALSDAPEILHPLAVPFETVNVTAPVPDPPDVVRASGFPVAPFVDVMLNDFCVAWVIVYTMVALVTGA